MIYFLLVKGKEAGGTSGVSVSVYGMQGRRVRETAGTEHGVGGGGRNGEK